MTLVALATLVRLGELMHYLNTCYICITMIGYIPCSIPGRYMIDTVPVNKLGSTFSTHVVCVVLPLLGAPVVIWLVHHVNCDPLSTIPRIAR